MSVLYKTPGVYREEVFPQSEVRLPTGIPGFIGFFTPKNPQQPNITNVPIILHRLQEFTDKFDGTEGYLAQAVVGFFENRGSYCYVVCADAALDVKTALVNAIKALSPLSDVDLLAIPDAMNGQLDTEAIIQIQQQMLKHCTTRGENCFAILDSLPNSNTDALKQQRKNLLLGQTEPVNGALYYPWIKNTQGRIVPPCGHVAGIISQSDRTKGVFKAPANEEINDALDLEIIIDNTAQDELNLEGINCLRVFPGRGIRVWGARTLSRDPNWRYLNVRRLFLTLGRWINLNMRSCTFEPNTPQLWVRIQRELNVYLTQLWQAGALQGQTPDQAFYVKCDAETNPRENRETGEVVTEIGLAASEPAEFLIVRIIHRSSTVEIR